MYSRQLELRLGTCGEGQWATRHERCRGRARWWFERMRRIVEHALEPVPVPPPEQMWFRNGRRQAAPAPPAHRPAAERQIYE